MTICKMRGIPYGRPKTRGDRLILQLYDTKVIRSSLPVETKLQQGHAIFPVQQPFYILQVQLFEMRDCITVP